MENYLDNAIILPTIAPLSYQVGGMEEIGTTEILFPDGDVRPYIPMFEIQAGIYFDTYGCTSFSFNNACEVLTSKGYLGYRKDNQDWLTGNIYKDGKPNFSDRDLVIMSGTVQRVGNSGQVVLKTAQDNGLISETLEPWDFRSRDPKVNIVEVYYAYARNKEDEKAAEEYNKRFKITGTWVAREDWAEASKTGALQVYVKAWAERNGKYYNPTGTYNHAVMMASYKDKLIYDTYQPEYKELESWNDAYYWALKINIIEKTMEKPIIKNNSLVILVEGAGAIGLYLDGKIIIDDVAKVLSVYDARTLKKVLISGQEFFAHTSGTVSLTQEQWNLFPKTNLKGEVI